MTMRVYLDQIGCRLNYSEMETLAQRLVAVGHQLVDAPEEAQVIVFNSCAVTAGAERDSRKRVGQLHRANTAARIAVTGCWATRQPLRAAELPGVALVADNQQKDLLHSLLEPWSAEFDDLDDLVRLDPDGSPFIPADGDQQSTINHQPSIVNGWSTSPLAPRPSPPTPAPALSSKCRTAATTSAPSASSPRCVGRAAAARSLPLWTRSSSSLTSGAQEAVLTGVHLGSYGRDLSRPSPLAPRPSTDLKQLVAAILTDTDITRLRLSSLEPWELADGFFDLWARWPDRLCPHLHLPLQAGTDRQLRSMARRCTTASFHQLVDDARAAIPDLIVTTDLIVGFPGETESDFAEGIAFVEELRFAHAHLFPFSAREGTAAATFKGQVPSPVKKERLQRMQAVVERTGRAERARFVGTVRPVLWEGVGQPLADQPGCLWSGLTDNYLRVMTVAPPEVNLRNRLTAVMLDSLQGDVYHGVEVVSRGQNPE